MIKLLHSMATVQPLHYVGFWKRVLSKLIDIAILGAIMYMGSLFNLAPNVLSEDVMGRISAYISLACFYYVVSWWKFSGTLGNHLLGQRVVNAQLERPTSQQVAIRFVIVLLSECIFSLPFLSVAFDPKKRGLHDKAAGTFVVEARDLVDPTLHLASHS